MATNCAAETGEGADAASYDGQKHAASYDGQKHDDVWLAKQCRQIARTTPIRSNASHDPDAQGVFIKRKPR